MEEEIKRQQAAEKLVKQEIYHNLALTTEKELKDNPELLLEASNYYPQNEEGERDKNGKYPEIYEFWAVSDALYEDLEERGEVVFQMLDFNVWGRQTTGQAICMDKVIQDIAEEYGF